MKKKKNVVITGALGQDSIILSKLLIKIKYNFTNKVKGNSSTPIGDNKFTARLLNWSHKKNIFVAAKELNLKF